MYLFDSIALSKADIALAFMFLRTVVTKSTWVSDNFSLNFLLVSFVLLAVLNNSALYNTDYFNHQ